MRVSHTLIKREQLESGAKLEGGVWGGGGGDTPPPPKAGLAGQIIWIGRANHLDWQGNEIIKMIECRVIK